MPFESVQEFQRTASVLLVSYYDTYILFKPTHYKLAMALKDEINSCESSDKIVDLLYEAYCDVIKKNSHDLALKLAYLIAEELGVKKTHITWYHNARVDTIYQTANKRLFELLGHAPLKDETQYSSWFFKKDAWKGDHITGYLCEGSYTSWDISVSGNFISSLSKVTRKIAVTLKDPIMERCAFRPTFSAGKSSKEQESKAEFSTEMLTLERPLHIPKLS